MARGTCSYLLMTSCTYRRQGCATLKGALKQISFLVSSPAKQIIRGTAHAKIANGGGGFLERGKQCRSVLEHLLLTRADVAVGGE